MDVNEERYVVFSDLHGRTGLLEACYKRYGDTVTYISGGDAIDAPEHGDVKATVDLLQNIGAICLYGNHEWVLSAAMHEPNEDSRRVWAQTWANYERGVLKSYGLRNPNVFEKEKFDYLGSAAELKEAIHDAYQDTFFENLVPYFETDKFICLHGGLAEKDVSWNGNGGVKQQLDLITAQTDLGKRQWGEEPDVIFDPEYERSKLPTLPSFVGKILITGHNHTTENSISRVSDNGKRVRLASNTYKGMPLYVYESWTGGVTAISEPTGTYF